MFLIDDTIAHALDVVKYVMPKCLLCIDLAKRYDPIAVRKNLCLTRLHYKEVYHVAHTKDDCPAVLAR